MHPGRVEGACTVTHTHGVAGLQLGAVVADNVAGTVFPLPVEGIQHPH